VKRANVRLSDAAVNDILEQADWYEERSGRTLSKRWEIAVTSAILSLVENPLSAPPCGFSQN
jgi:plasmid stabilization system protein ParE